MLSSLPFGTVGAGTLPAPLYFLWPWLNLGPVSCNRSMTQQIYNKTAENEKNKGAAMGQLKSRPQSD